MNQFLGVFRCNVCGNMNVLVNASSGTMVCCNQNMEALPEKSGDQGTEKHTPVFENTANGVIVKIGSVPHPMEDEHFIQWIEVQSKDNRVYRQFLKPGQSPQAEFCLKAENIQKAREYCNKHGLWKSA